MTDNMQFCYEENGQHGVVIIVWGENKYRLILHKEMAKEIVRRCEAEPKQREDREKYKDVLEFLVVTKANDRVKMECIEQALKESK